MSKCLKYIVKNAFIDFLPQRSDFEIFEEKIPPLHNGEFLIKAEYISVDPYMRSFASEFSVPYEQFGFQVGKVVGSKNSEYPVNTYVVAHAGWRDFAILNGDPDPLFNIKPYQPDLGNLPISLAIGSLGMPGITAYLGLLEICKPKRGEIVCVTSAAGAVGSLVGQIAKLKGCTVIGFAGSDQKVQFLKQELGFDFAFNYKSTDIKQALRRVAAGGVNCFFDNVGGDVASVIMESIREHGRVAVCGSISTYGENEPKPRKPNILVSVKIESFSFTQWEWPVQNKAIKKLKEWVQKGDIKVKETVTNGFDKLPDSLIAMLKGENIGKAIVKV